MPRRPGTKAAGPHSGEDNRALLVAGKLAFVAVSAFSYFVLTALRWTPLFSIVFVVVSFVQGVA